MNMTDECPHGTYYPVEPCNPCGLEDGRIGPLVRGEAKTLRPAKFASKCAGCGDPIEVGESVSFGGPGTGKRPWCFGCSTVEVVA